MGKKYLDTKKHSVESSILSVWQEASLKQEKLDAVNKNAVKKKFDDRKDKDIDNDGDVDDSDKYLHKRRKAVSKAVKDEGNAFGKALRDAKEKGEKTFVVAGKTYDVKEEDDLTELTPAQKRAREKSRVGGRSHGGRAPTRPDFSDARSDTTGSAAHRAKRRYYPVGSAQRHDFKKDDNTKMQQAKLKRQLQKKRGYQESGKDDDIDEKYTDAQRKARERGRVGQRKYGGAPDRASSGVGERPGDERTASLHNRQRGYKKRKPMGYGGSAGNRGRYGFKDQFIPAGSGKNESYEMGTDEYRKHTQEITPGQEIQDYGRFKVQSMKEALAKVWGLDESESSVKKEKKDLTKELKGGKTLTGKESDTVDVEPKLEKKK